MKKGWERVRLGEMCQFRPPKSETRKRLAADAPVSFFGMEDLGIDEKHPRSQHVRILGDVAGSYTYFAEGDVLLAKITPCFQNGKLGIAKDLLNGVGFGSSEFIVIRPSPELDREYLYYFLSRADFRIEGVKRMGGSVGHQRVPTEFVQGQLIPLVPLPEQRRIVGILDEAFEGIATARTNAEKNLQNARALFESHLQATFTQRGEGWVCRKVGEIAKLSLGKMLDKAKNQGEFHPYLRNLNVRWFEFDTSDMSQMRFLESEFDKYTAVRGDVLVCEGGYPGRAAIWDQDDPVHFQKAIHRVRFSGDSYNRWFIYYLYAQSMSGELRRHFTGTGIQHFTGAALRRFEIPIPPTPQLRSLVSKFDELAEQTQHLESLYRRKLTALDALKKSLLHRAFSGQL